MCSKHVEARNKLIVKQTFCASSWLITEISSIFFFIQNVPYETQQNRQAIYLSCAHKFNVVTSHYDLKFLSQTISEPVNIRGNKTSFLARRGPNVFMYQPMSVFSLWTVMSFVVAKFVTLTPLGLLQTVFTANMIL